MPTYPFRDAQPITQLFGVAHPRYTALGIAGHNGIDFGVPVGTEVIAVESGEVWEVEYRPEGFGYYVKVRTEAGADWLYAHNSLWHLPRPGEWVGEGAVIALTGTSGLSTGPHLHLGYRPLWWVRGWPFEGYVDPAAAIGL